MRITLLGASGGIGRQVVELARDRDVQLRAVWRRQPENAPEHVELAVEPDLLDVHALRRVTRDADAIICAVGQRRRNPRNPWSRLVSPPDLCLRLATTLHAALSDRRPTLLVVSAAGVGDSRNRLSWLLRLLFDHSTIGIGYHDLADMEAYLASTGRDCLVVRPTTLTNGRRTEYRPARRFRLWSSIPRRGVATYLLDRAQRHEVTGLQTEMIT